jgi:hypothetical protein
MERDDEGEFYKSNTNFYSSKEGFAKPTEDVGGDVNDMEFFKQQLEETNKVKRYNVVDEMGEGVILQQLKKKDYKSGENKSLHEISVESISD